MSLWSRGGDHFHLVPHYQVTVGLEQMSQCFQKSELIHRLSFVKVESLVLDSCSAWVYPFKWTRPKHLSEVDFLQPVSHHQVLVQTENISKVINRRD